MRTQTVADFLRAKLAENGGFTVRLVVAEGNVQTFTALGSPEAVHETERFAVGGAGPLTALACTGTPESIEGYIDRLVEATGPVTRMGYLDDGPRTVLLGGWRDPEDGTVWLEPVSLHGDWNDAFRVAASRVEKAYQDLATGTTYYVGPKPPEGRPIEQSV